jgi:hypothetical protein
MKYKNNKLLRYRPRGRTYTLRLLLQSSNSRAYLRGRGRVILNVDANASVATPCRRASVKLLAIWRTGGGHGTRHAVLDFRHQLAELKHPPATTTTSKSSCVIRPPLDVVFGPRELRRGEDTREEPKRGDWQIEGTRRNGGVDSGSTPWMVPALRSAVFRLSPPPNASKIDSPRQTCFGIVLELFRN